MLRRLALLAFVGAVLASSVAAGNTVKVLWPDGSGHDHSNPLQHGSLSFGAEQLSHVNIGQAIGEVDVHEDAAGKTWVLAAMLSGGFALIDGTDPAAPVLVSKTQASAAYGADAKLSDDTNTVFLALNAGGGSDCQLADLPVVPMVPRKNTCGVQVWDTTAKDAPVFLGTLVSSTGGTHMMDYEVLNGVPTIALAAFGSPGGVPIAVVPLNKVAVTVGNAATGGLHDVTLTMDPQMPGRALAVVANGGNGVSVWDITVPALPVQLGQWSSGGQYVHTVMMTVIEGKRVIVASEETGGSGQMWFIDASDYGAMTTLGTWTNPDGRSGAGYRWSPHDLNIAGSTLYLAHYHGGMLAFDIGTLAALSNPTMVANFLPAKPRVSGSFSTDVPFTWDAVPFEGVVWLGDINTGVYAVRLT